MAETIVALGRNLVEELMVKAGFKGAGKWDNERLANKLEQIAVVMSGAERKKILADPKLAGLLTDVEAAIEDGKTFEITDDEAGGEVAASATDETEEPQGTPVADAPIEEPEPAKEPKAKKDKPKKDKPKKERKPRAKKEKTPEELEAEKEKAEARKQREGLAKIRPTFSRAYCCGVVLAKHGLKKGITEEMANEVDEMYGNENKNQTWFLLANAWHTLNGTTNEYPVKKSGLKPGRGKFDDKG